MNRKKAKLLGPWATAFTLFKGFVATGVLYIPKDTYNAGYVFMPITMLLSGTLTLFCAKKLLDAHEKIGGGSFSDMG